MATSSLQRPLGGLDPAKAGDVPQDYATWRGNKAAAMTKASAVDSPALDVGSIVSKIHMSMPKPSLMERSLDALKRQAVMRKLHELSGGLLGDEGT